MNAPNRGPRAAATSFIFVTLLLDTLGIGLLVPITPRLIEHFLGGNVAEGSRYYGIFVSAYAVMQFFFAPILGGLSDRFGRRVVILGSLFGAGCDYIVMSFAPSLAWLFVGRIASGATGASFSCATAYITDVTPPEKRAQSFGLIGAAFGIGFIVGPAIGGALGDLNLRLPFLVAAGLNLLNFAYGAFVLPESLTKEHRRPFSLSRANPFAALKNFGRHPILLGLAGTLTCSYLAQQILQATWALYTQGRFNWSGLEVGFSLAAVGLASIIIQGGLLRQIMPRLGERGSLIVGTLFSIAGFAAFGFSTAGWMMYAITFPFSLRGIAGPATQALLTREVGADEQGELQGSLTSLMSVTAIVGPLIGTRLFSAFGDGGAHPYVPGAPYFAAAVFDAMGLLLAVRLFGRLSPARPGVE